MMKIQDAPYIVEAERCGVPPYGEPDYSEQIEALNKADLQLDKAIDLILNVEDDLQGTEYENDFRDLLYKVEDIGCLIRAEMRKIEGR